MHVAGIDTYQVSAGGFSEGIPPKNIVVIEIKGFTLSLI
jgi:hypothetical protein